MRTASLVFLFLFALLTAFAQTPVRTENFVYSILAYNERDFSPTFVRAASDTVYLIAGADSFLSAHKTLVYYWPLTEEWKVDSGSLDVPVSGVLEIRGSDGSQRTLQPARYTYFNVRGEYEMNWKVARGAEAERVWSHWQDLVSSYNRAMRDYADRNASIGAERALLIGRIERMRREGRDVAALVDRLSGLLVPPEPEPPTEYTVPPVEIQEAFILNLPRGEYSIRMRTADGSILEDSEKTLVVHERRRAGAIGYDVIPGDRWTRPVESSTPSGVLYVDGTTDVYLRPFFEEEFNDLDYAKTVRNDARGNPNIITWERIQQVPSAAVRLTPAGQVTETVLEKPWFVEQIQGTSLGYRIIPYDPQGAHKGREPSLIAFHIPIGGSRAIRVVTLDAGGVVLAGSDRQIRIVGPPRAEAALLLFACVPLLVMVAILVRRARMYRGAGRA